MGNLGWLGDMDVGKKAPGKTAKWKIGNNDTFLHFSYDF